MSGTNSCSAVAGRSAFAQSTRRARARRVFYRIQLTGQLFDQSIGVINVLERLGDARHVDGDRPVLAAVVAEIPAQRLDVAIEDQPDRLTVASDHGRA